MACISDEKITKDGRRYYRIRVGRGKGCTPYSMNWYPQDGWCKRTIVRELQKAAAEFEIACQTGKIENRQQIKARKAFEAAEAAKIKNVSQYSLEVFMPTKELSVSENTRSSYQSFLELHILPVLGDVLLKDVTPAMIQKLLVNFQKKHSHASTIKLYNILNGIFEMAFLDDSIPMNPLLKVKRPAASKEETAKQEAVKKSLTIDELRYILDCISQEPLKWQCYIHLAADTGARRGELCGLRWSDIDFDNARITIQNNLQYTQEAGVFEVSPKNGKVRKVDVGAGVLDFLRRLRAEQATKCISRYVFSEEGQAAPMHPQSPTRYFKKLEKRYGLERFTPHMLRHTSASVAITSGADVVSVSERLGHADTAITLRMYSHANEESIRRAGQVVRDALEGAL